MSNIEKIKAEIERRMKTILGVEGLVTGVADNMRYQGYKSLLAFIDSLPEEKPSEDFPTSDEEMAKFLATHPKVEVPEKFKTPNWLFDKQHSEDLEEAAEEYVTTHFRNHEFPTADSAFIAGAKWQKEQDAAQRK